MMQMQFRALLVYELKYKVWCAALNYWKDLATDHQLKISDLLN